MEFGSTERFEMVYETIKNIEIAIERIQERTANIKSADDFRLTPWGMEKLDATAMVIIGLGEALKTLDKLTEKKLLCTYPSIEWKKVMGPRDIMAHHYFEVDPDEVFSIVKTEIDPLKEAITFFKKKLFG